MKAVIDCEWEVRFKEVARGIMGWIAFAYDCGLYGGGRCCLQSIVVEEKQNMEWKIVLKEHWEKFAKLNDIKKWKYSEEVEKDGA